MKRAVTITAFLLLMASAAFARLSIQEWNVTYFKADCAVPCLMWMGDADSARIHYTAVERDGILESLYADTTLFGGR